MRDIRLGDDIDDYCVRCKRIMNHAVVSVIGGAPAKVRCRTCHSDHDYRHEQAPPPKADSRKAALFQEVLKKVNPNAAADGDAAEVPEVPEVEIEAAEAVEVDGDGVGAPGVEEETPPAPPVPTPKVKAKAKPKLKAKK